MLIIEASPKLCPFDIKGIMKVYGANSGYIHNKENVEKLV
jgi:hypothetical protein